MLTVLIGHFLSPFILLKVTSSAACTTISAKKSLSDPMILEDMEVLATFIRQVLPRSAAGIERFSVINLQDSLQASLKRWVIELTLLDC